MQASMRIRSPVTRQLGLPHLQTGLYDYARLGVNPPHGVGGCGQHAFKDFKHRREPKDDLLCIRAASVQHVSVRKRLVGTIQVE